MGARRLDNGSILATVPVASPEGPATGSIGDGLAELAPGEPGHAEWDAWLRAWEDAGEDPPDDDLPAEWPPAE